MKRALLLVLLPGCFVDREQPPWTRPDVERPPQFIPTPFPEPPPPDPCSFSVNPAFDTSLLIDGDAAAASLSGVDCVRGDVFIQGGVTTLDGLAQLQIVGGHLFVQDADLLTDTAGLAGVQQAAGLTVADNDALTSLGLASLSFVGVEGVALTSDPLLADLTTEVATLSFIEGAFVAAGLPLVDGCAIDALASRAQGGASVSGVPPCGGPQDGGAPLVDGGNVDGGA